MATIIQRDNGKWQAKVRPKGYPAQSKTFLTRRDAEAWARTIETEQDRGLYIQRSNAEKTTLHRPSVGFSGHPIMSWGDQPDAGVQDTSRVVNPR